MALLAAILQDGKNVAIKRWGCGQRRQSDQYPRPPHVSEYTARVYCRV